MRGDWLLEAGRGAGAEEDSGEKGSAERELEQERKRNQELLTRLKYVQADFENYRKRVDKEMKEAGESLARGLVSRLLVVQDELAMAAKHSAGEGQSAELREGIGMVQRNLEAALESVGVERIDCVGKPFDPALHEAVEKVEGESEGEDVVVEELRPGFTFRGQLVRPSMVKVELALKTPKEARASE
jgi:molecular chaperone GrpE